LEILVVVAEQRCIDLAVL